jgi:hypothetical protein
MGKKERDKEDFLQYVNKRSSDETLVTEQHITLYGFKATFNPIHPAKSSNPYGCVLL